MTPLDLSRQSPRSCRVEIDGIPYLARAIDKTRAELPGGDLGPYLILHPDIPTISSMFYRRMGITHDEFAAAVRDASTEDDVAAWLRPRIDEQKLAKWRGQLLELRLSDIPEPVHGVVVANHPIARTLPETTFLVDVFDADDRELYGGRAGEAQR